jgi:hypothetical protein
MSYSFTSLYVCSLPPTNAPLASLTELCANTLSPRQEQKLNAFFGERIRGDEMKHSGGRAASLIGSSQSSLSSANGSVAGRTELVTRAEHTQLYTQCALNLLRNVLQMSDNQFSTIVKCRLAVTANVGEAMRSVCTADEQLLAMRAGVCILLVRMCDWQHALQNPNWRFTAADAKF